MPTVPTVPTVPMVDGVPVKRPRGRPREQAQPHEEEAAAAGPMEAQGPGHLRLTETTEPILRPSGTLDDVVETTPVSEAGTAQAVRWGSLE